MARGTPVPITPTVLAWAVEESGYAPHAVAKKVGVSPETFQAWVEGEAQPKLTEFRKLATLLKRTPATFLLPEPPRRPAAVVEFRRPQGTDRAALNPSERRYLRDARRLQELVGWMQGELGQHVPPLPEFNMAANPEAVAARTWMTLLPRRAEADLRTSAHALRWWRSALERRGVLVFSFPMGREAVRGFSIWHDNAPVIAVNTAWRVEARSYTLFHEFGHLLTRTASACPEAGRRFARPADSVERWCEQFSAAVLLPAAEVERFLTTELGRPSGRKVEDLDVPSQMAARFRVSLRAATMRLIEMKLATWDLYASIPPVADNKPRGGGGRGRERGEIREGQYGDRTLRLFVGALSRDVLGRTDVLDALDISDADLMRFERRAARSA